jgi:Alginate export
VAQVAPPDIQPYRFDEDYGYLRDPASHQGFWWETLKDIPLNPNGVVRLDLGSDLRFRNEDYRNDLWDQAPAPNDSYLWYRALPYAALRLGYYIRLFGQFQVSWSSGVQPAPGPTDQTQIDLGQAFLETIVPLGDIRGIARVGRQVLSYGTERLVGLRYGPNVLQPFDTSVGRLAAANGDWRVDLLYARPVATNPNGSFNDHTDYRRALWGVYSAYSGLPWNAGADLYYLGYLNTNSTYEQGTGVELRNTLGLRLFGNAAAVQGSGPDWNFEFFYQFGDFNGVPFGGQNGPIEAWSVASDSGYTFGTLPWRPRIGLRANAISGDTDPNNPKLNSFNAMFPRGSISARSALSAREICIICAPP